MCNGNFLAGIFSRPCGTWEVGGENPALKRLAIAGCPFGNKGSVVDCVTNGNMGRRGSASSANET